MNYNNLSLDTALSREFSKMGMTVKGLSLRTCCYDSKSRMSFEEPNDPRSSEIGNNQIQLTELATYEERTPGEK